MDWMLVVAGALTGFIVGLTGVGGGALMTPILLLIFGVTPMAAVGTDLWFAAITKLFATRIHHKHGLIDWQVVKRLWWGSLTASFLTLIFLKFFPVGDNYLQLLKSFIAFAVLITALGMLLQKYFQKIGVKLRKMKSETFKTIQAPLTIVAGGILGVLVTLTSVGAGALGAVLLAYLYPLRLTPPRLIATDIVHAIPLAIFAGIGHLLIGNVDFVLLGSLLVGSIPTVVMGASLSSYLPHTILRTALAVVLLAIGLKLFI